MREIKFRAWVKADSFNEGGMYTGFSFGDIYSGYDEANTRCTDGKTWQEPKWSNATIMQYTGLKDKNGKEIYEGDIVLDQWTHYDTKFKRHEVRFGQHETSRDYYASTAYGWFIRGKGSLTSDLAIQIEVIGNIYENPELLESEKQ